MEVTGWDSVVFTFTPPRAVFARVREVVLARWSAALVEGHTTPEWQTEALVTIPVERLPTGDAHLVYYRDTAMYRHTEQVAYAPMDDGDGPFAVITRAREDVAFEIDGLNEVHAANHRAQPGRPPDPYPAWLCTPELVEVTAVTPGDPRVQPFSAWVLEQVRGACRAPT